MSDCIFCKIVAGEIPSNRVWEDDRVLAFRDLNPMAPTHVLVVPKKHIANLAEAGQLADEDLAACLRGCAKVAELEGLTQGFRVVSNCGPHACQSVQHLHFHVLGGKQLSEKMD